MLCYYFVVVLSCVLINTDQVKAKHLPNYIVPCSKSSPDLNTCATEHGRKAVPTILKGIKKFKIPVLAPLQLDKIEVRPSRNFELVLTNITVYGLDHLDIKDIRIDEAKKHATIMLAGSGLRIKSDYRISGQILVLPVSGEGKSDFKFDECNFMYTLDYNVVKKSDGNEYAEIKKSNVAFKINKAKFYLGNLFNGNKELGDNMNKVLNENHEAVLKDLGGAVSQVIETIATGIFNSFLGAVPYEEIFLP